MLQGSPFRWFTRFGLGAALPLFACGVATAWFGDRLQLPPMTTGDGAQITLNRYVGGSVPDVILVGSSLTVRLEEEYFATPGLRNLGLAGGSPVTGLEIIARQPRLPRLILVETNVLTRSTDDALIAEYAGSGRAVPLFFRPLRAAVAAYENWRHAPMDRAQALAALHRLIEQPPRDFDNRIYESRASQQWNAEDPTAAIAANITGMTQLISALEQRGARVLLFELPLSSKLEGSRLANITREMIHKAYPDPDQWLHPNYPSDELRWADGVHLDKRSAAIVAQSFDKALASERETR